MWSHNPSKTIQATAIAIVGNAITPELHSKILLLKTYLRHGTWKDPVATELEVSPLQASFHGAR